jgi:hypothetical protein
MRLENGYQADRLTLLARIERENSNWLTKTPMCRSWKGKPQLWLGSQVANTSTIDPAVHAELRIANDHLLADNAGLSKNCGISLDGLKLSSPHHGKRMQKTFGAIRRRTVAGPAQAKGARERIALPRTCAPTASSAV